MESHRPGTPRLSTAAYTATKFETKAERPKRPTLLQQSPSSVRKRALELFEGREREAKELLRVRLRTPFRRQPVEQLEQIASEREAGRVAAQGQKGCDQARLIETRDPAGFPAFDLNAQVVEEIQGAGEAPDTSSGSLGNGGESTRIGCEQVHDPIGLAEIKGPKQQGLGLETCHVGSLCQENQGCREGPGRGEG